MTVILGGVLFAGGLGGRDDSPPSEAGLVPACAPIADGENGYLDFLELRRVLVVTAAALKAYRLDKGSDPASLAALAPGYLPEAPTDPFDGEPLSYSNGSFHSQGRDLEGKLISP